MWFPLNCNLFVWASLFVWLMEDETSETCLKTVIMFAVLFGPTMGEEINHCTITWSSFYIPIVISFWGLYSTLRTKVQCHSFRTFLWPALSSKLSVMSVMYLPAHTGHEAMFQLSQHTHMLARPYGLSLSWVEHMPKLSSSRQDVAHVHHITPTFSHDLWVVVDKQLPCTTDPASAYWYFTLVCHAGCRWECLNWRRLKDTVVFPKVSWTGGGIQWAKCCTVSLVQGKAAGWLRYPV